MYPVDRVQLNQASRAAEVMICQWSPQHSGFLGVAAEPIRGPLGSTFLVGRSTFPGLGQEGELVAAWSVAELITRTNRVWQKRRRQMWTKVDTGLEPGVSR